MTSALLFVAVAVLVLVLGELTFRRWMRPSESRRREVFVDLDRSGAEVIPLPSREHDTEPRRDERQSS